MWQEERSQQYLEEEAGYGQADCSIIPGTRELHGLANHGALPAICARQLTQIRKESSQLLGALIMWFAG